NKKEFYNFAFNIKDFVLRDKENKDIGSKIEIYSPVIYCTYTLTPKAYSDININNLRFFTSVNSNNDTLVIVDTYSINPSAHYITAELRHFSIKAVLPIGGLQFIPNDLSQTIIYPNPYQPYDNDPSTGIPYNGSPGSGVYFRAIKENTVIKVFDIRGKLVFNTVSPAAQGYYHWNARNNKNEELASGVYLAVLESGSEQKVIKFVIIR
ncbi:MAG TPA: T9SS type A sorting domain-containing protein, partial [bacterium]|nr:T9SS type A sorting domain-containing protein [bacterium]